jgi:hypothetical protein
VGLLSEGAILLSSSIWFCVQYEAAARYFLHPQLSVAVAELRTELEIYDCE